MVVDHWVGSSLFPNEAKEVNVERRLDQTSRLHSPWKRQHAETWHEVARPQIHGHDIYTLAIIDQEDGLSFASGAEETIVRLFDATRNFVESATSMSGVVLPNKENRPLAAVVPPLGLSNRAVSNGESSLCKSGLRSSYRTGRQWNQGRRGLAYSETEHNRR